MTTCRTSYNRARNVSERDVERYLAQQVRQVFGARAIFRKLTWQGRRSAPDRVLMIPPADNSPSAIVWVELKRPGEKPRRAQLAEFARMRAAGATVRVVSSFDDVRALVQDYM